MVIRLKRRTLLAYALSFSSVCLVLWVILFIASDHTVSPIGGIELTAEDSIDWSLDDRRAPPLRERGGNVGQDLLVQKEQLPLNVDEVEDPVLIPNNTALRALAWGALSDLYHRYLSHNQVECQDVQRLGRITDGGWDVCNDRTFTPKSQNCVVYSFGVDNDFSFDDAVVERYGCRVYSFDPSMELKTQQRGAKSFFYRQGLADSDRTLPNGWVMSRMETIRAALKHTKTPISIVKMDIEEWEWEVLPDLLTSDMLKSVGQLLIELHQCEGCAKYNPEQEDKEPPRDRYIHMLELLNQLYQQNFRIFYHHDNRACLYNDRFTSKLRSACSELGFVRIS